MRNLIVNILFCVLLIIPAVYCIHYVHSLLVRSGDEVARDIDRTCAAVQKVWARRDSTLAAARMVAALDSLNQDLLIQKMLAKYE